MRRNGWLLLLGLAGCQDQGSAPVVSGTAASSVPSRGNTIRWTITNEMDNFGYDVYRSELPDGPFQRLSRRPVLGSGTTDETVSYRYVDNAVTSGRSYYYYVESISMRGERETISPVIAATSR